MFKCRMVNSRCSLSASLPRFLNTIKKYIFTAKYILLNLTNQLILYRGSRMGLVNPLFLYLTLESGFFQTNLQAHQQPAYPSLRMRFYRTITISVYNISVKI